MLLQVDKSADLSFIENQYPSTASLHRHVKGRTPSSPHSKHVFVGFSSSEAEDSRVGEGLDFLDGFDGRVHGLAGRHGGQRATRSEQPWGQHLPDQKLRLRPL